MFLSFFIFSFSPISVVLGLQSTPRKRECRLTYKALLCCLIAIRRLEEVLRCRLSANSFSQKRNNVAVPQIGLLQVVAQCIWSHAIVRFLLAWQCCHKPGIHHMSEPDCWTFHSCRVPQCVLLPRRQNGPNMQRGMKDHLNERHVGDEVA